MVLEDAEGGRLAGGAKAVPSQRRSSWPLTVTQTPPWRSAVTAGTYRRAIRSSSTVSNTPRRHRLSPVLVASKSFSSASSSTPGSRCRPALGGPPSGEGAVWNGQSMTVPTQSAPSRSSTTLDEQAGQSIPQSEPCKLNAVKSRQPIGGPHPEITIACLGESGDSVVRQVFLHAPGPAHKRAAE